LTYSFLEDRAPEGMTIDPQNGLIRWPPTTDDVGKHAVIVVVRDSFGGLDSQRFDVVVSDADVNKAPVIVSTPTYRATVGRVYSYAVKATDPEGDALTFALASAPKGMTIDATTGAISWTPTSRNVGSTVVSITATDAFGNVATQTYALVVRENQAPVITSTPNANAAPKTPYSYDVVANDPEGDAIEYRLVEAPEGMTLDATSGRLR